MADSSLCRNGLRRAGRCNRVRRVEGVALLCGNQRPRLTSHGTSRGRTSK
jgi:hypothetical protein